MKKQDSKKTFVVLGGNFANVGAEAMTFVTVSELRNRYPGCRVVMISKIDAKKDNCTLNFEVVGFSDSVLRHELSKGFDVRYYFFGIVKLLLRKGNNFKEYKCLKKLLKDCDAVFDISGYALSSQWSNDINLSTLRQIDVFLKHNIPFYFMPQSFGPFDYKKDKEMIISKLKSSFTKSRQIFARENEGYKHLSELIDEEKIVKSFDMVLQSEKVVMKSIYKAVPKIDKVTINTDNNVAIIPNMRNFDHGNKDEIITLYKNIVNILINHGKNIYLISHSFEDGEACQIIKNQFANESKVIEIGAKINSLNFEELISQFDFAVASRYHSIVHSYKSGTPCIALGWATKYRELLESVEQEEFVFDVRKLNDNTDVLSAVEHMITYFLFEREKILNNMKKIQNTSCFDQIDF